MSPREPSLPVSLHELSFIDRREAIKRVSALLGGVALVGSVALLTGCAGDRVPSIATADAPIGSFTVDDQTFLAEVADTILPDTEKSPGAKAAGVGPFMAVMVTDCYTPADQAVFRDGMRSINAACSAMHQTSFMEATPTQRLMLLTALDQEQYDFTKTKKPEQASHYFRMMRELTMVGFFTSEIGYTKAMRYIETPGRFDPCVPYTAGEKSWASHA